MASLTIRPLENAPVGRIDLAGSSFAGLIAMTVAVLADGRSTLRRVRLDDATRTMVQVLRDLGAIVELDEQAGRLRTQGWGGHLPEQEGRLDCGGIEIVADLTTALCGLGYGEYVVDAESTREPHPSEAIDPASAIGALTDLGAAIGYQGKPRRLPVSIRARGLRGGHVSMRACPFETLAALLVVAPYAGQDVYIELADGARHPQAAVVCSTMAAFGVSVVDLQLERFIIPAPQRYRGREFTVPPESNQAALSWMAAAITNGSVEIDAELSDRPSAMGCALDGFERFGAAAGREAHALSVTAPGGGERLRGAEIDLTDHPEMSVPLALTALFAASPTVIKGVSDDDTTHALIEEMSKLGAAARFASGHLLIEPPEDVRWTALNAHGLGDLAGGLTILALAADRTTTVNGLPDDPGPWEDLAEKIRSLVLL